MQNKCEGPPCEGEAVGQLCVVFIATSTTGAARDDAFRLKAPLRLEKDAWSMVKRLTRATTEYAPPQPPDPQSLPGQKPSAEPCYVLYTGGFKYILASFD